MADLEDVQTVDLMSELLRRLKCAQKPDKRLIFIGTSSIAYLGKRLNLIRWIRNLYRSIDCFFSGEF